METPDLEEVVGALVGNFHRALRRTSRCLNHQEDEETRMRARVELTILTRSLAMAAVVVEQDLEEFKALLRVLHRTSHCQSPRMRDQIQLPGRVGLTILTRLLVMIKTATMTILEKF